MPAEAPATLAKKAVSTVDLETLTGGRNIWVGLQAQDKESAIELLLDCLLDAGAVDMACRADLLDAIMTRERRLSTGLEQGIAIPHGTTCHVEREIAALGIFPGGVPFETVDDHDVRLVILLLTPAEHRDRHVSNLARIARQLLQPGVRNSLLAAQTREDALAAIRSFKP
ncbi:MAG TPA: hypothetical protein DEA08_15250 [Planctomycetes bacterium]|nr:hypothetical protein [Planctomycetota bacterium]|tara:strand:+ start:944 stop:1453 length:510 start_codon:yes stop_codon:yes gene_type:complete